MLFHRIATYTVQFSNSPWQQGQAEIMSKGEPSEFSLSTVPTDGISQLAFCPTQLDAHKYGLLASSWDCSLYFYNVLDDKCLARFQSNSPLLTCAFDTTNHSNAFTAGLDGQIYRYLTT